MDLGNAEDRRIFFGSIGGILAVIFLHFAYGFSIFGSIMLVILGVVLLIFLIHRWDKFREKQAQKAAFQRQHPHYSAEEFYRACWKAGARSATTEKGIATIVACAKAQYPKMTEKGAINFFLLGQSEVRRIKEAEQLAFLAKLSAEEKEYETYINRFAHMDAHKKVAAMCAEFALEKRELLKQMQEHTYDGVHSATKLYNMSKRKEYDWAALGGIASGIGGIGAGVSVAVDAQIKNAEIRQQNKQLENAYNQMAILTINSQIEKQGRVMAEAESWEHRSANAGKLKVKELPQQELLDILSPVMFQKAQNKTGSMVIKVKIPPFHSDKLKIGQTQAVIDGTFKAVFWKDETRVGEAILTLPLCHTGHDEVIVDGICRNKDLKYKERYTVTFEPNALWLIENVYRLH